MVDFVLQISNSQSKMESLKSLDRKSNNPLIELNLSCPSSDKVDTGISRLGMVDFVLQISNSLTYIESQNSIHRKPNNPLGAPPQLSLSVQRRHHCPPPLHVRCLPS